MSFPGLRAPARCPICFPAAAGPTKGRGVLVHRARPRRGHVQILLRLLVAPLGSHSLVVVVVVVTGTQTPLPVTGHQQAAVAEPRRVPWASAVAEPRWQSAGKTPQAAHRLWIVQPQWAGTGFQ